MVRRASLSPFPRMVRKASLSSSRTVRSARLARPRRGSAVAARAGLLAATRNGCRQARLHETSASLL
eukprot:6195304-Pleurochrysis_carterae.AAC.1